MEHLQTASPALTFEAWLEELAKVTAEQTKQPIHQAMKIINKEGAYEWWKDGFTPYATFRETYGSGNFVETSKEDIWRANGKTLGYPQCCIDAFVIRCLQIHRTGQDQPLDANQEALIPLNTGFVPCPACAAKVAAGTPLADLITNRATWLSPFPHG